MKKKNVFFIPLTVLLASLSFSWSAMGMLAKLGSLFGSSDQLRAKAETPYREAISRVIFGYPDAPLPDNWESRVFHKKTNVQLSDDSTVNVGEIWRELGAIKREVYRHKGLSSPYKLPPTVRSIGPIEEEVEEEEEEEEVVVEEEGEGEEGEDGEKIVTPDQSDSHPETDKQKRGQFFFKDEYLLQQKIVKERLPSCFARKLMHDYAMVAAQKIGRQLRPKGIYQPLASLADDLHRTYVRRSDPRVVRLDQIKALHKKEHTDKVEAIKRSMLLWPSFKTLAQERERGTSKKYPFSTNWFDDYHSASKKLEWFTHNVFAYHGENPKQKRWGVVQSDQRIFLDQCALEHPLKRHFHKPRDKQPSGRTDEQCPFYIL